MNVQVRVNYTHVFLYCIVIVDVIVLAKRF